FRSGARHEARALPRLEREGAAEPVRQSGQLGPLRRRRRRRVDLDVQAGNPRRVALVVVHPDVALADDLRPEEDRRALLAMARPTLVVELLPRRRVEDLLQRRREDQGARARADRADDDEPTYDDDGD